MSVKSWINVFHRECLLIARNPIELIQPLLFFVIIVSLFPLTISPDPQLLVQIGPGVIWMAILFAIILSFPHFFVEDYQDGSLEQFVIDYDPLSVLVIIKVLVHTGIIAGALMLLSPLLAFAYHLSIQAMLHLLCSVLLALPSLCMLGALGASVVLALRNGTLLLALILLPLYVPILIFASSAVIHAELHQPANAEFALLTALLLLIWVLAPPATSYCLKVAVEN